MELLLETIDTDTAPDVGKHETLQMILKLRLGECNGMLHMLLPSCRRFQNHAASIACKHNMTSAPKHKIQQGVYHEGARQDDHEDRSMEY